MKFVVRDMFSDNILHVYVIIMINTVLFHVSEADIPGLIFVFVGLSFLSSQTPN